MPGYSKRPLCDTRSTVQTTYLSIMPARQLHQILERYMLVFSTTPSIKSNAKIRAWCRIEEYVYINLLLCSTHNFGNQSENESTETRSIRSNHPSLYLARDGFSSLDGYSAYLKLKASRLSPISTARLFLFMISARTTYAGALHCV